MSLFISLMALLVNALMPKAMEWPSRQLKEVEPEFCWAYPCELLVHLVDRLRGVVFTCSVAGFFLSGLVCLYELALSATDASNPTTAELIKYRWPALLMGLAGVAALFSAIVSSAVAIRAAEGAAHNWLLTHPKDSWKKCPTT